jgi:hypothetical protein
MELESGSCLDVEKPGLCVVIPCTENSTLEVLGQTLDAVIGQENNPFNCKVIAWCSPNCTEDVVRFTKHTVAISYVAGTASLDPPSFLDAAVKEKCEYVLLCSCGMIPHETCFASLKSKISEYGDSTILTAFGICIFPHKQLDDSLERIKGGAHWKLYGAEKTDRAVHFFTSDFSLLSVEVLRQFAAHSNSSPFSKLGCLWYSFVAGRVLSLPVWKIEAKVAFKNPRLSCFIPVSTNSECFEQFYTHLHMCNWPRSISNPFYDAGKLSAIQQGKEAPQGLWRKGFGGVNMSSEPASQLDFAAAAAYGVKVIRVGAVCDAQDLNYLINPQAVTFEEDEKHFLRVVGRLRKALGTAGDYGLRVIITMTDLPGCKFQSRVDDSSFPFWESPVCRSRAVLFWGLMAKHLADISSVVMGYDLINEPFTPEDLDVDFFGEIPLVRSEELHQFYMDALHEIRQYDREVRVVVKCTWFGCPKAFNVLQPLPDNAVVYSFHMYASPHLTLKRNYPKLTAVYPGPVSRWVRYPAETVNIDAEFLKHLLESTVVSWQRQHKIPSHQILVAEFGMCRETEGTQQYLGDIHSIFAEFGWSWLLFSFRDEEWDAMDYELGPDLTNMLNRTASSLFMTVAGHFH